MINENPKIFDDPKVIYPDQSGELSFADYIVNAKSLIMNTRLDLQNNDAAEKIIKANTPFEFKPATNTSRKRVGALLIHGLYDSPFIMKDIATHLQAQGIWVRSVLLPGHGTVPGALLNVALEDWIACINYGVKSFAQDVDEIFLVGFSLGASLAFNYYLEHPKNNIAGIIALAPAIKIYSSLAFITNWHRSISWYWTHAKWLHKAEENDYAKYQSCTFNSVYQVYRLCQKLKNRDKKIECPVLMVLTQNDRTISSQAALNYFLKKASSDSKTIFYSPEKITLSDSRIEIRPTGYSDINIIDFSHVAIPVSPENFHYGKKGDYLYSSRVEDNIHAEEKILYDTSNNVKNNLYYRFKMQRNLRQRLTFNPDFDYLCEAISSFVSDKN